MGNSKSKRTLPPSSTYSNTSRTNSSNYSAGTSYSLSVPYNSASRTSSDGEWEQLSFEPSAPSWNSVVSPSSSNPCTGSTAYPATNQRLASTSSSVTPQQPTSAAPAFRSSTSTQRPTSDSTYSIQALNSEMKKQYFRKKSDCKFYYYGKCSRGGSCDFRHEPLALGSKVVCPQWTRGRCQEEHCRLRHMKLVNNKIPCFSKQRYGNCRIPDCPFNHSDLPVNKQEPNTQGTEKGRKQRYRNKNKPSNTRKFGSTSNLTTVVDEEDGNLFTGQLNLPKELIEQILTKLKEAGSQEDNVELRKKLEDELVKKQGEMLSALKLEEKKKLERKIEEAFTCVICFELFVSPVTLNCSHSFCQFCIKEWRKDESTCPICRKHITSEILALNIQNCIDEIVPDFSEEMKLKREETIKLRQYHSHLAF